MVERIAPSVVEMVEWLAPIAVEAKANHVRIVGEQAFAKHAEEKEQSDTPSLLLAVAMLLGRNLAWLVRELENAGSAVVMA